MRALVLCAGYGTRLKHLTNEKAKCMIEVAGRPVLEHILDYLNEYGIYDIIVNTHHKPESIQEHFGTRLLYSYEKTLLGEKDTIRGLRQWLGHNFVVVNGDTLTTININNLITASNNRNSIRAVTDGVYAGIRYVINAKTQVEYETSEWWCDIGTFEGLERAKREWNDISRAKTAG